MYGQPPSQPLPRFSGRNEPVQFALEWIDYAVQKARSDILAAGRESVSVWNVTQAALLILQAPSWESLGVQMQQVPSLYRLILTEAKVAVCENQGVTRFEMLELGPLLHHPLVAHAFSLGPDITEVFAVKSEEINSCLAKLAWKRKRIPIGDLLGYIRKIRSVRGFDRFCVQMHNLGKHIIPILQAIEGEEKSEAESNSLGINENNVLTGRQEKAAFTSPTISAPSLPKSEVDKYTRMFVRIWKQTCKDNNVSEVFEQMLTSYQANHNVKRKKAAEMFSSYPWAGLLNAAVTSMKLGLWDGMYDDDPQASGKQAEKHADIIISETEPAEKHADIIISETEPAEKHADIIISETEPAEKHDLLDTTGIHERRLDVTVEDIIKNISTYIDLHNDIPGNSRPGLGKKMFFLTKLCTCEHWLTEQFSVKEFESLGYGPFFAFLEQHVASLPPTWKNFLLFNDTSDNPSLEACMSEHHLKELVVQASNSLRENEDLSKQKISELLTRQFPSVCFNLAESGHVKDFQDIVREKKSNIRSQCVVFSATLHASHNEKVPSEAHVMANDATEVLLRAPMLIDLNSWSHWDLTFFPSLGPLVGWLLNEVNTKELLCLVTKSGEVIRVDHLATVDSFLEAFLQGSSFRTAVILLSLLVLYGGEQFVPLSLLKCHARKAFEVLIKNIMDLEVNDGQKNLTIEINKRKNGLKNAAPFAASFILDCLHHLPAEFHSFAANLLLSGLQAIVKDAPLFILNECKQTKQRIMLHELGLSLGIVEWISDYHTFRSSEGTKLLLRSGSICLEAVTPESVTDIKHAQITSNSLITFGEDDQKNEEEKSTVSRAEIPGVNWGKGHVQSLCDKEKYAASVIETIRREEFGLDPSLSVAESSMLKKQHARLGRALHCLSQELYSQDSHFLLELVQNADDNMYPADVEPTLTFILQEGQIIVLNNEQGFNAENIRALCDVGNSTKKEIGAGYIGKKGIGFKSVFRVTDVPEIHSNGFHIKFDKSEGQIGFILPTTIPPCDRDLFRNLVSVDTHQMNTWILLPFKSKLTEAFDKNDVISMFSDLHPSLLLFLHRLQCIKFINLLNDSLTVMRREVVGGGIVNISIGEEKITWLIESRKLQADSIRNDVSVTEISIAFTLEESGPGNYIPKLAQQPVFAFLPLRMYGLKFIIQGDFVLPSSREEIDADSPWNQWLFSEFPNLFVSAEKSFCDLPCYRENPGKGVSAFMSFVPLVGEVHGFFSSLPRMIISKLRISNCLLLEGYNEWVPPCRVLRNWTEHARTLLPKHLLQEHLGLGFLRKDISIPDSLARTLGIQEYGPKILLQIMSSLCRKENGLKLMGLGWLGSWIDALYVMSLQYYGKNSQNFGIDSGDMSSLQQLPFIPILDDQYSSVDEGTIWLHSDSYSDAFGSDYGSEVFPRLYSNLRMVNPALLALHASLVENITQMLCSVGVQKLSAHDVIKVHILPAISHVSSTIGNKDLMMEYVSFIMLHLQSNCPKCHLERENLFSELRKSAFILTNHGYKRPIEVSLHFNKDYENPIDIIKLIIGSEMKWYEVDSNYLKYPITKSSSGRMLNWRNFFQELGVSDFVCVAQVDKCVADISYVVLKNIMLDKESISPGSIIKDWESQELVHLLSHLSSSGDRKKSSYLLEVLDTLWDDSFSDKVSGYYIVNNGESRPFKSSFLSMLHDVRWMASSMDDELHYPKDLYYDCKAVRSILGANAPYAIPKVRNEKLVNDIGLKTQVTLDDSFSIIEVWRRSMTPFRASISQMSNFYTFIGNEVSASRLKILENMRSGAFIFVPSTSGWTSEAIVVGVLVSPQDVFWYDPIGFSELLKDTHDLSKSLRSIYPSLHDFFVKECGVTKTPPLRNYLQFLLQLSTVSVPSYVAHIVFQVFKLWAEGLESGLLTSEDVEYLKESICEQEITVLPTVQNKWVSLHVSFGLVCWSDDETLSMEFKHVNSIHFLHFGELDDVEQQILQAKVSSLMRHLGIHALSEIVTREAIQYGRAESSNKTSLVRWALPYAQRYVYNVHPNKYAEIKQSGFKSLNRLRIIVVNKLLYRNIIKRSKIASAKHYECNCLLQGDILYTSQKSDSHSVFVGLSRFLFDGVPELHLANFLHMIRTMTELGSTTDQTEFFILNSQKVPMLPDEEPIWTLPSTKNEENLTTSSAPTKTVEPNTSTNIGKTGTGSYWRPINPRNTSKMSFANKVKTDVSASQQIQRTDNVKQSVVRKDPNVCMESNTDWTLGKNANSSSHMLTSQNLVISGNEAHHGSIMGISGMNFEHNHHLPSTSSPYSSDPHLAFGLGKYSHIDSVEIVSPSVDLASSSSNLKERGQLSFGVGTSPGTQALLTGRLGEIEAFKYLRNRGGEKHVRWVNETNETGLPYDILVGDGKGQEYVEVKTTNSTSKDWFTITIQEWQFAVEKGDLYSIARVVLLGNNMVRITIYKNPARLCQQSQLQLALLMLN